MLAMGSSAVSEGLPADPCTTEGTVMAVETGTQIIPTRYGDFEVDRDKTVTLPKGLIGFGNLQKFAVLNLPHEGAEQFKLLQSIDEPGIGFYVAPVSTEASGFDDFDLQDAADHYGIALADLAILLIVTAHQTPDGVELTANLRAPVLVDTANRLAYQHVMVSDKYPMRQKLH